MITKDQYVKVDSFAEIPNDGKTKLVFILDDSHPRILWYAGASKDIIIVGGEIVHSFTSAPKITHYLTIEMP